MNEQLYRIHVFWRFLS